MIYDYLLDLAHATDFLSSISISKKQSLCDMILKKYTYCKDHSDIIDRDARFVI